MVKKIIIVLIALLNGGWMIFDGIHVLLKGKYFGPETPGPWSNIISSIGINPFKFGIPFIILGLLWIIFLTTILLHVSWGWYGALITAIATLWYLPVGTILSIIYIVLLIVFRI